MKKLLTVFFIMNILSFFNSIFSKKPIVVGHRGACGYEPENTLRSFKRAIDMGVQMIELDVYVCRSGELVVMHDDTIDRTTNGQGNIMDLSWDILKKYDAGKGEHIPLLSEVFDLVDKRVIIDVELKGSNAAKPVADLISYYIKNKNWSYNNFLVTSFNNSEVFEFNKYCPQVKTGVILMRSYRLCQYSKKLTC